MGLRGRGWLSRSSLALATLAGLLTAAPASAAPRSVGVRFVWLTGHEGDRTTIDSFADCLFRRSNFEHFWQGDVTLRYEGSSVIEPPASPVDEHLAADLLSARGTVDASADVYVLFSPATYLRGFTCGANATAAIAGRTVSVGVVRIDPPCWPGLGAVRSETQLAEHEAAEAIDQLLGHAGYAGDGACEGDRGCPSACASFTGLACPGAPSSGFTGCDANPVNGWVVQALSHGGRDTPPTTRCFPCDFQLRYCPLGPSDPACANDAPPPPAAETASPSCAFGATSTAGASCCVVSVVTLAAIARRRRRR